MTYLRRTAHAFAFVAIATAGLFAPDAVAYVGSLASPPTAVAAAPDTDTATVKVILSSGHGSGVHIGGGFVLTAAHVTGDEKSVQLKTKDGQLRQADVLWVNKTYDIALLRTSPATLGSARLSCRVADPGEPITGIGNPINVEFVKAFGKIAGEARETGPWKSVYITDVTTVMGQSGGPVFAANGDVIGITVGVMGVPMGFSASLVGYGFVVPSHDVCALLGRTA